METSEDDYSAGEESTGPEMAHLAQCFKKTTVAESLVEDSMITDSVDPGERSHAGTPVAPGIALGKAQPRKPKDGATKRGQKIGSKSGFNKSIGYSKGTGRPDSKLPIRKGAKASPIPRVVQGRSPAMGLVTTVAGPSRGKTALGEEPALLRICMKKKRLQKETSHQPWSRKPEAGSRTNPQGLKRPTWTSQRPLTSPRAGNREPEAGQTPRA